MSTARTFRLAWKLTRITPMRLGWILLTRFWAAWTWLGAAMWGLVAWEDRLTHLYNTYHMAAGPVEWTLWVPGVLAIILGFATLIWLVMLGLDNPFGKWSDRPWKKD
jgi:hypothetical protein